MDRSDGRVCGQPEYECPVSDRIWSDGAADLPVYGNAGAAYGDSAVWKRLDQTREDQSVFSDLLFCGMFG